MCYNLDIGCCTSGTFLFMAEWQLFKFDRDRPDTDRVKVEDLETYMTLGLPDEEFDDEAVLIISQIPIVGGQFQTAPGFHSLELLDEDDFPILQWGVVDPALGYPSSLLNSNAKQVPLANIEETLDALNILRAEYESSGIPNVPPHDTTAYPVRVSSVAFEAVVQMFHAS